jgi:hypothetical protein
LTFLFPQPFMVLNFVRAQHLLSLPSILNAIFKPVRHCPMLVGHSLLLLLPSACRSFLGTGKLDDPHSFSFFSGLRYGIAISSFH